MTEATHNKLNRWLDTIYKCLRICGILVSLLQFSPASGPHHEYKPAPAVKLVRDVVVQT